MNNIIYKNFSWNLAGSFIYALTQYLLVVVIGRFGSSDILGIYSLGLALTAPMMMFTNLKLRTMQSTGYYNEFNFNDFAFVRICGNISFFILVIILSIIFGYRLSIISIILLVAVSKIIESFSDLFYGTLQYNERLDTVAKSYVLRGVSSFILFSIIFIVTNNLHLSLLGIIISWFFVLLIYDLRKTLPFINLNKPKLDFNAFKSIIVISIPLGLLSLLASLNVNLPRIIIEKSLSLETLGYFTAVFYLTIILGKFVTSLGSAVLPRLSKLFEAGKSVEHLNLTLKLVLFIATIGVFLLIISYYFGKEILILLYGEEFKHLESFLVLVMLYGLFNYLLYSIKVSLESTRTFKPQMYVEFINVVLTLILSLLFIPTLGLNGAIYSLIISSTLSILILSMIYVRLFRSLRGV